MLEILYLDLPLVDNNVFLFKMRVIYRGRTHICRLVRHFIFNGNVDVVDVLVFTEKISIRGAVNRLILVLITKKEDVKSIKVHFPFNIHFFRYLMIGVNILKTGIDYV